QKIWVKSRRARLKDMAEVLRIQYFERNPQPFFQHFTRCRTQVIIDTRVYLITDCDSIPGEKNRTWDRVSLSGFSAKIEETNQRTLELMLRNGFGLLH
ncbi:MAG: hypothetical protein KME20_24585, partial [Kaiparowitsia implicata GSE-PSE-MK54-09C]|nr:hypothetical protein [Kaiparowitsia implicata GSE-PSE-MK54-09C]